MEHYTDHKRRLFSVRISSDSDYQHDHEYAVCEAGDGVIYIGAGIFYNWSPRYTAMNSAFGFYECGLHGGVSGVEHYTHHKRRLLSINSPHHKRRLYSDYQHDHEYAICEAGDGVLYIGAGIYNWSQN